MVVLRTVNSRAKRRHDAQALEGGDHLFSLSGLGFFHALSQGLDSAVTHHRAQARIVFVLGVVGVVESLVLRCLNTVPGVAGDNPAVGCFFFERVQVLGLAGQQADHFTALEEASRVAFAYELGQVSAEQDIENRVGLGVGHGLHHAARIHLAQRRCLLGHKLDVRLSGLEQLLEAGGGRLTVLVVGVHDGPALFLHGDGIGHQHGDLHVSRGAQAVGVAVAVLPDDLVSQRLRGQKENFLLLGKVGQRQADVRQEGAGQDIDFFTREQLFGGAHGFAGVGVVVTDDQLEFFAVDAACGIDLFNRQVHAFFVGLEKSGLGFVAVDLTDLDDALRMRKRCHQASECRDAD